MHPKNFTEIPNVSSIYTAVRLVCVIFNTIVAIILGASEQDTHGESRQRHLAVHPHVALHLPLQMFLGRELMRRAAVAGGGKRHHEMSIN